MRECQNSINKAISLTCHHEDEGIAVLKEKNISGLIDYDHCLTSESVHALMKLCYGKSTSITTLEDYNTYQQMKEL